MWKWKTRPSKYLHVANAEYVCIQLSRIYLICIIVCICIGLLYKVTGIKLIQMGTERNICLFHIVILLLLMTKLSHKSGMICSAMNPKPNHCLKIHQIWVMRGNCLTVQELNSTFKWQESNQQLIAIMHFAFYLKE